ncbi:hypothetical protein ScalyP_jg8601 [Parmales sp. scaly parma]|nr:hypothetical protein ScalyP_jg8601 [Parmales sp. scaly parma]
MSSQQDETIGSAYSTALTPILFILSLVLLIHFYKKLRARFYSTAPHSQRYTPLSNTEFQDIVGGAFQEVDDDGDEDIEDVSFGIDDGEIEMGSMNSSRYRGSQNKAKKSPLVGNSSSSSSSSKVERDVVGNATQRSQAAIDFEDEFDRLEGSLDFNDDEEI